MRTDFFMRLSVRGVALLGLFLYAATAPAQNGPFLYVATPGSNNISAYTINSTSGLLTPVAGSPFGAGSGPVGVAVDPTGKFVYASNQNYPAQSGSVSVYTINATSGALTPVAGSPFQDANGEPYGVAVDPGGKFAYLPNVFSNSVSAYSINATSGALTPAAGSPFGTGGAPEGVAVDPTGKFVYVPNSGSNSVSAYTINETNGALTPVAGSPFGTGSTPQGVANVAFDSAGKFAYITNDNSNNISVFSINAISGALTPVTGSPFGTGTNPSAVAVHPTGKFLYVVNNGSNNISVYSINATSGALTPAAGSPFGAGTKPAGVAVDPTGKFAYVTNSSSNSISVYTINAASGALTAVVGSTIATGSVPSQVVVTAGPGSQASQAAATLSVVSLAFGSQAVGQTSAQQSVSIINTGTEALNITDIAITGTNSADYAQTNTCGNSIAAGASCGISVTFTPAATGARTASIIIADNASNSPQSIALTGTGQAVAVTGPTISAGGIVPIDSTVNTIQAGEWVSIYGTNLAGSTVIWNGVFLPSLGGTSVTIDGMPAYLLYVSPRQIDVQVPDDSATGPVSVVVTTSSGSATATVTLSQFGPSFSLLDTKHVAGIIIRSNGTGAYGGGAYDILGPTGSSLGYATVAAKPGDIVELFGFGFGPTTPAVAAGQAFSGAAPTNNAVNVLINNVSVTPIFAGLSSAGLYQINLVVPSGLGSGDVPLQAAVDGMQTQSGVVISLQNGPATSQIQSLTLSSSLIAGGTSVTGTVVLSAPAPSGGVIVFLSSSSNNASLPASVTIPAGSTSATFAVATVSVSSSQSVMITGVYSGASQTTALSVTTPAVQVSVVPATATVQTGGTIPFASIVTGTANTAVSWSVNGVVGGSATVGTVSTTGIYTAPAAVPNPNAVTVKAASSQSPSQSAVATVSIAASAGNGITISSLSNSSAAPLGLLTINGSGFDTTAQLQVTFFNSAGYSVAVPVLLSTSTSLVTSVPPFFDGSGNPAGGTVNIDVVQLSSAGTTTYSNVLSGFQIQALASAPAVPTGTLTLALLEATLQTTSGFLNASGTAVTPALQSLVSSQITSLQNTILQVQSVMNGTTTSYVVGQFNGANINVGLANLAVSDRFVASLLTAFASPEPNLNSYLGTSGTYSPNLQLAWAAVNPQSSSSTPNPVQSAAQAALKAAMTAVSPVQLTQLLANFTGSFVRANPEDAETYAVMMLGVFAVAADAATVGLAGFLALTAEATSEDVFVTTALAGISACTDGIKALGSLNDFEQGALAATFLSELEGQVFNVYSLFKSVSTFILNGGVCKTLVPSSLSVTPPSLNFTAVQGGSNPGSQILSVDSSASPLVWSAVTNQGWLSISPNNGTTSTNAAVSVVIAGLCPGSYTGAITFTAGAATNTTVTVPVTLTINPSLGGQFTLTVATLGTGSGTVGSSPSGTSCGSGVLSFAAGTAVTLTEAPATGSTFAGWGGACGPIGTGTRCVLTMNSNQAVAATFNVTEFNLSVIVEPGSGGGTVTANPPGFSYPAGTVVTLTETPNVYSTFYGWGSASGLCSGTASTCTFKVTADDIITATFIAAQYTLSVVIAGTGSGTVSVSQVSTPVHTESRGTAGLRRAETPDTSSGSYEARSVVTLIANPNSQSTFAGWSGACSGTGSCVVTMDSNQTVTATFNLIPTSGGGGGTAGGLTGTWAGQWTESSVGGDFCTSETFSLTWALTLSGSSLSGTYVHVVTATNGDFCPDSPGDRFTGSLVDGKVSGTSLTIFTDENTSFSGTYTSTQISGTGGDSSQQAGPFTLIRQ